MRALLRKPAPPLDAFVNSIHYFEAPLRPYARERVMPDGCPMLIVNLSEDRTRIYDRKDPGRGETINGCILVGAQTEYNIIDTAGQVKIAGVHFKPGGAYPFLAPPADELHGAQLPLDVLWGRFANQMRERMLEAETPEECLTIMEQALLARARRPLFRHRAVEFALLEFRREPHSQTIGEVTEKTGLSPRRFIEVFRQEVGMTPKLFCRLRRFQQAIRRYSAGKPVEWTEVALEAGYFDQAHFIHDFRAFSGINPSAYAAARTQYHNHVRLD
ncbi:MAG: helix-turn-helix domain-containing protein [Bryobacteraceae bacterium]|jgi:AraC-like DNA-binding protein